MTRPSLRLALLALALTAGRTSADIGCVSDIRDAAPNGSFCHGSTGSHAAAQTPSPAAAAQLNSMAAGAVGGAIGGILGNALVTPLANPYQGHVRPKPVVGDDDDVFKTHPIGITAADDIIGSYKADDNSYAGKLNHFRQLHDAEMEKRRDALDLIKGTSAEKWCAAHINILFPSPPVSDVLNRYANTVRAYDREKQTWDKRCGGPSVMPGYDSFTEGLAALKPDAVPGAASPAHQASAVKMTAPAYSEPDEPAKTTGPSKAADEDELLPTPAQTKTPSGTAEAPAAPDQAVIAPPPAAPADAASGPSPDDSVNTNHSTEFFGIKNAKVTQADLQDQRAPDLTSPKTTSTPGSAAPSFAVAPKAASGSPGQTSGAKGQAAAPPVSPAQLIAPAILGPGGKISPAKTKTPIVKKKVNLSPAKDIIDIIKKSPAFYAIYLDLKKDNYQVRFGPTKDGTYIDKDKHRIYVSEDQRGDANAIAASLAHEFGHSTYKNKTLDATAMTRDDFSAATVKDDLADEGEATLVTIKIKKELKANKGPDIEVPGAKSDEYQKISDNYPDAKDHGKAREEIGAIFAKDEQPSAPLHKGGPLSKDYQEYYSQGAEEYWDSLNPKKKSP